MGRRRWNGVRAAALGVAVAVVSLSGVAYAKSWAKLAPGPLASDSTYEAFLARPADSLSVDELSWLEVQRDWRAQRLGETMSQRSIAYSGLPHRERSTDKRFAALASRPYADLTDRERAWLVTENAAQRAERDSGAGAVVGGVVLGALVGAVVAVVLIGYALSHVKFPL